MARHLSTFCLCAVFIVLAGRSAGEGSSPVFDRFTQWGDSLVIDDGVIAELGRFERKGERLGSDYIEGFASDMRRAVLEAARGRVDGIVAGRSIAPFVEVSYPKPGFERYERLDPKAGARERFEEGFIKTEALAFFKAPDNSPEEAMRSYTSPEFRRRVSSRIEKLWTEGNLSCIETKGVKAMLDPTMVCNRIDELVDDAIASQHSQVVSNQGDGDYQIIFFKESLKTFIAIPGGIAVHYINYTRGVRLGRIKRSIGKGKIRESQERQFGELRKLLESE